MDSVKRTMPLSPHIGIYKPQISSVLSILHRVSGVVNFIGLVVLVWWSVCFTFATSDPTTSFTWQFFSGTWGHIVLILWSFSLFFHFCSGIRHLLWDAGIGFEVRTVTITGWMAIAFSILLTTITWYIIFSIM